MTLFLLNLYNQSLNSLLSPMLKSSLLNETMQELEQYGKIITIIKDGFNIIFFIVAGVITVITYLKARKTVLQPIKTEVFKQQLIVFSEIMEIFNGKTELDIRDFFGFDKMVQANSLLLLDSYASFFFDIKIDSDRRPYNLNDCPGSIVKKEHMEKYFTLLMTI